MLRSTLNVTPDMLDVNVWLNDDPASTYFDADEVMRRVGSELAWVIATDVDLLPCDSMKEPPSAA